MFSINWWRVDICSTTCEHFSQVCLFGSINAACRWRITGVQFALRPSGVTVAHLMAVSPHNAPLQTGVQNFAFRNCETIRAGRHTCWRSLWIFVDWRFKRVTWQKKKTTTPNTVSQKAGKAVQKLSAPFWLTILLVQECDDWYDHSSSVTGAASLLRMRLRPSDPEPVISYSMKADCNNSYRMPANMKYTQILSNTKQHTRVYLSSYKLGIFADVYSFRFC